MGDVRMRRTRMAISPPQRAATPTTAKTRSTRGPMREGLLARGQAHRTVDVGGQVGWAIKEVSVAAKAAGVNNGDVRLPSQARTTTA